MSEFTTHIEIHGSEVLARVYGDYSPAESMTATYPGCAESADIGAVECVNGKHAIDILPLLNNESIADLETQMIEHEAINFSAKRLNSRFASIATQERDEYLAQAENQRGVKS